MKITFRKKGKFFFSGEFQLIKCRRNDEKENIFQQTLKLIVVPGKNYQWILTLVKECMMRICTQS